MNEIRIKMPKLGGEKLYHLLNSDRSVQYCCDLYQKTLKKENIQCSMTEKYDPYQNTVVERINGILKQEFLCRIQTNDFELMSILIDSSIKIYNEERSHFSNFILIPN